MRCPELSKLPKSPRFTSILWRHQSPGSIAALLTSGCPPGFLDPSHPATRCAARTFPQYKRKELYIRIFPLALLREPPTTVYPFRRPTLTWAERVNKVRENGIVAIGVKGNPKLFWKESGNPVEPDRELYFEDEEETLRRVRLVECRATPKGPFLRNAALKKAKKRVPMSFFTITSKARMGALRCVRRQITLRVKAALNLIVGRGAYYGEEAKRNSGFVEEVSLSPHEASGGSVCPIMKFDQDEAESMGRKWILQGWTYAFAPTVEVYRMPYSKLIPILREALSTLRAQAIEMENRWLANSLSWKQQMPSKANSPKKPRVALQAVNKIETQPSPLQNSNSKPTSILRPRTHSKPRPTPDNATWKRNLEAELQLLTHISKAKR